jgi:hypothetical protein
MRLANPRPKAKSVSGSPAKQPAKRSPNRQRMIARAAVWTVFLSGAAVFIPHMMF